MDIKSVLDNYNKSEIRAAALGGHSALDVGHGMKQYGFKTTVVAQAGREKTYTQYYANTNDEGCINDVIIREKFKNVLDEDVQEELRNKNAIMVHNRYFWVYLDDYDKFENNFNVPIFGSRTFLKLEERDQPYNQYHLLTDAGIRIPKIFKDPKDIDRLCLVKAAEATRGYERAFFLVKDHEEWQSTGEKLEKEGKVSANWREATIEEFVVGPHINFNFFYSPLTKKLELVGTDTRRQTNLDGFLRLTAEEQMKASKDFSVKMIEMGHIACTVKESWVEKAFELGERFVTQCGKLSKELDPSGKGIIGPFALQGAIIAEDGKEDFVAFDVSFRVPGSPGIAATPYSTYLHGKPMSMGERIGLEFKRAQEMDAWDQIVT